MKNFAIFLFICLLFSISCGSNNDKLISGEPLLYLPDDLQATLWAESPMFYNPTNMDVDAKGRIWVTEAVNYRNFNNDSGKVRHHAQGDRVMILEDTNHDGKADVSKVFVQDKDLISPLGIAVIGHKIYVSCSPNLIVYSDTNSDDKPDKKEILLTGFGGRDHDHGLHSVVGGPDGKLYLNAGNAGPHIVSDNNGFTLRAGSMYTGGSPYNTENRGNMKSDDGKVWVGGIAMRMDKDARGLKVLAHNFRNAYELAVDSKGDMWQNDNDDQVLTCRTTWLMEGGNAGYFSADGTRYWEADKRPGQDIFTAHWHQEDPGVLPAGDNFGAGSPTGIVVNEGDGLGEAYRGMLLSADAGRNVIFGYYPKKYLSGYKFGKRSNLITSLKEDNVAYVWNDSSVNRQSDKWFRPSDVTIGTDGAIYVCDWYDPVVGGHQMKDSIGYGRIYRITRKGKTLSVPEINFTSVAGQLEALKNPAVNVRHHAFQLLKDQGEKVIHPAEEIIHKSHNPYHQARAIWLMANLGEKGKMKVAELLDHQDEEIRCIAFRALRQVTDDVVQYAEKLKKDPSGFMRREVAIALSTVPYSSSKPILLSLILQFDGKDRWYLEAIGNSLVGNEQDMYDELVALFKVRSTEVVKWDETFLAFAWRLHPAGAVKELEQWAAEDLLKDSIRLKALTALAFIKTPSAVNAMQRLSGNTSKTIADAAAYWLSFRRGNDWFSLVNWDKMILKEEKIAVAANMPDANLLEKDAVAFPVNDIARMKFNTDTGKMLFTKNCATCHKMKNEGRDIGPDLTAAGRKFDRKSLLDAIIHPSAAIVFGYEPWLIRTHTKGSYLGFMIADGTDAIVIKDVGGKMHTLALRDISSREKQNKSIMPGPSELNLTKQEVSDIAGYISSIKEVNNR